MPNIMKTITVVGTSFMRNIFVVINESYHDSWSEIIWSDIADEATVFIDNSDIENKLLKRIKKIHFSNSINKRFWIPFKQIWDKSLVIKRENLISGNDNIIIFQSNVKFSPHFIKLLKNKYGCRIVLYLPDTAYKLGIGQKKEDIDRYLKYYYVDKVYSFDTQDCNAYSFTYFDIYSSIEINNCMDKSEGVKPHILYVGNCRSKRRLELLYSVYMVLRDKYQCDFYINGVKKEDIKHGLHIHYNEELTYRDVLERIGRTDAILELVNENQIGNTLRFKEAICYNKYLITNNTKYSNHKYDSTNGIITFSNSDELVNKIDVIGNKAPEYDYDGEFSPKVLIKHIGEDLLL